MGKDVAPREVVHKHEFDLEPIGAWRGRGGWHLGAELIRGVRSATCYRGAMSSSAASDERPGRGVAAVGVAATGFSFGFILVKLVGLPGPVLASARLLVGGVAIVVAALVTRRPRPVGWGPVLAAGFFFGLHQLLYVAATQLTSIAIVTLLGALMPMGVALVSRRAIGEPVPASYAIWSGMAVLGVALVVLANAADESHSVLGDGLAVVNVAAFLGYLLSAKRARQEGTDTLSLTAGMLSVALLVVLPGLFFVEPTAPAPWQWGYIALLALGPGNGHILVNWAHARTSAALTSLVLSAVPLMASLWAHLVFDEPYGWPHWVGALLVAGAVEGGRRAEARQGRALTS